MRVTAAALLACGLGLGSMLSAPMQSDDAVIAVAQAALAFTRARLDAYTVVLVYRDRGVDDTVGLRADTARRLGSLTGLQIRSRDDLVFCGDATMRSCRFVGRYPGLEVLHARVGKNHATIVVAVMRPVAKNDLRLTFESYQLVLERKDHWQVVDFTYEVI